MDSNDTTILALSLGIPSATLLSIAFLLALRIQQRQLQARETLTPTVPTASAAPIDIPATPSPPVDPYYGIPLEQRPPRVLAPLPRQPIPLNDFARVAEQETVGGTSGSTSTKIPERRPPTPPRRCQPVIILSPSTTAADSPSVDPSPSPGEYGHYRDNGRGFDVGRDIRVTAPPTHDHTWDANPAVPSAPVSPSEFWDNITIPLSAYIPAPRDGSPEHRTPPASTSTLQHRGALPIWDQPVPTNERPLKSIPSVEEPVASTSCLPVPDSNDSSYWSNAIEQRPGRRAKIHRKQWARIDQQLRSEPQPPPELLAPPESRYYEYFTDETTGEGTLQELPPRPDTPFPNIPNEGANSELTPEPPQSPTNPDSTSDGTAWCHQILPENSYGSQRRHTGRITTSWVSRAL